MALPASRRSGPSYSPSVESLTPFMRGIGIIARMTELVEPTAPGRVGGETGRTCAGDAQAIAALTAAELGNRWTSCL